MHNLKDAQPASGDVFNASPGVSEEDLQKLEARMRHPRYANTHGQIATVIVTPAQLHGLVACARELIRLRAMHFVTPPVQL